MLLGSMIGIGTTYSQAARAAAATQPPAIVQPAQAQPVPAQSVEEKAAAAVDKDNLQVQEGSQLQDAEGEDTEKVTTAEAAMGEEEANENLPGGGHSDPQGSNVDHQFNGVE